MLLAIWRARLRIRLEERGFGSRTDQKLSGPPSSTVVDAHPTVSTVATGETHSFGNGYNTYQERTSNLSTQLRRARIRNKAFLLVSALGVDHQRTHNSEQIRAAAIAHHTVYEKTRNLERNHVSVCQWGTLMNLLVESSSICGYIVKRYIGVQE